MTRAINQAQEGLGRLAVASWQFSVVGCRLSVEEDERVIKESLFADRCFDSTCRATLRTTDPADN